MPWRMTLTAAGVLRRHLGFRGLIKLLESLKRRKEVGEPWQGLPPPVEKKDIDSRAQIGDAILLYRALRERMPPADAERILREVVTASSVTHLRTTLPRIRQVDLIDKTRPQREAMLAKLVARFPNSEWTILESTDEKFVFRIHRCRFPELLAQVGHPELSDAFCKGDELYFRQHQPEIDFERPGTIGGGAASCDFIFKFRSQ